MHGPTRQFFARKGDRRPNCGKRSFALCLRKGFANTEKLPGDYPVNLGVEHAFHIKLGAIREMKLRFDCINVADEVYRLRDGSGLGISASQYGQRRTFLAGLSVLW